MQSSQHVLLHNYQNPAGLLAGKILSRKIVVEVEKIIISLGILTYRCFWQHFLGGRTKKKGDRRTERRKDGLTNEKEEGRKEGRKVKK